MPLCGPKLPKGCAAQGHRVPSVPAAGNPAPLLGCTHFKEEVEPQKGATGNDGKSSSIAAGDGLRHLRGVLGREEKDTSGLM